MADFYWVNGTGNWTDFANKWRIGGTGGTVPANAPTSADNVFFVDGSASGTFTVTVNTTATCANFDASGITLATRKMTLAGNFPNTLTVSGSWTNPTSTFFASTAGNIFITFNSTSTGNTITTNGVSLYTGGGLVAFDGVGGSWTLGSAFTFSGTGSRVFLTNGTLNLNDFTLTVGTFLSDNSNVRSVAFGATGSMFIFSTTTTPWSCATITNFSYTGTSSVTVTAGTNVLHGSTAGGSEARALNFTISANINLSTSHIRNLTYGPSVTGGNLRATIYGDLTCNAGMTFTADTSATTFAGSGAQNITMNGVNFDRPITFNGTGTVTLVDNFNIGSTRTLQLTSGTLNVNGKAISAGNFGSGGALSRTLAFGTSGSITLAASGVSVWSVGGSGLTTTGTTSTISMTSASAKTFVGGGFNYAAALNQGGAGTLTISGSNTFQDITNTYGATGATTITFTAGTTQTVSAFTASGTSGKLLTLNSSSAGTRFNLSDSSGIVNVSFCSIRDSNATGGARWNAYLSNGNVNVGNNIGWDFSQRGGLSPVPGLSATSGLSVGVGLVGNL